ncbi:MAG TPA: TadE/TadG family type IV pilus assembly protein [Candidatus Limnocylindria bacterium]|nr:TadE/TadG family type IV pilus assembly protein [Candidatus Limnocylindria bacterium]
MSRFRLDRRSPERGQSLVELAAILPILLLLLLGILDLGRAVAAYNSVSNAARSAARVAVVDQNPAAVEQQAIEEGFGLGLTPADIEFDANANDDDPCLLQTCEVSVSVSYQYTAATPVIGFIVGPITVRSETRLPIERIYTSAP